MQIKHIGFRVRGFYNVASFALKEHHMSHTAREKRDALIFWEKHGLNATRDYTGVSRSTLYAWRASLRGSGLSGLIDRSRAPRRRRRRCWSPALIEHIRALRLLYPNLGPGKVRVLMEPWCTEHGLVCPSVRTIARLIADAPDKMRVTPQRLDPKGRVKTRQKSRPKPRLGRNLRTTIVGECVAFDTIVRFAYGCRRYIFTATDHASRFAFAVAVPRANSANAARFAGLVQSVFPAPIQQVLTDNGSEFAGAFDDFAREQGWRHCYTYPKCPKMNAYNERFNRTVQEELVDFEEDLLADDLRGFNRHLLDWLGRYNGERPHWGLSYLTPCQAIAKQYPQKSRMSWHQTRRRRRCR